MRNHFHHYHNETECIIYSFFFFLLSLFFSVLPSEAHWVYAPQADSISHVWFRRAFISEGQPQQATITVSSTGYYKLYVNECNVGTALYYPLRQSIDSSAVSLTFDATPYLRPDTNVVALIYSPVAPSLSHRQIAVNIYGTDCKGKKFSYSSDESWLCRPANSCMTMDGGEEVDGRYHNPSWKAATIYDQSLWCSAAVFKDNNFIPSEIYKTGSSELTVKRVTSMTYLHISQNPLLLYLADSYWGFPRITLREAKRGEQLQIEKLLYTCSGEVDEQAYPVFSIGSHSAIDISGDSRFKPEQVNAIDLLETGETYSPSF